MVQPTQDTTLNREMRKFDAARLTIANGYRAAARERVAVRGAADRSSEAEQERRYELAAQRGFVLILNAFRRYQASQGVPVGRPAAQPAPAAPDQTPQVEYEQFVGIAEPEAASSGGEALPEPNKEATTARKSWKERRKQAKMVRRQRRQC